MRSSSTPPRQSLNLRIRTEDRGLIDRAARLAGKTRTDFVLDAAKRMAEETLLDRAIIQAEPGAFSAFIKRLDAPARPNPRLRKSLRSGPPWDDH